MSGIDLILGFLLPSDSREECLGDLYEGYFLLREKGKSKFVSILITIWRAMLLILAALQMRWDDINSSKKEVQHTLDTEHSHHHKNTDCRSNSLKPSLQVVYSSKKDRVIRELITYNLGAEQHSILSSKLLKYFLLSIFGLVITHILSMAFGTLHIVALILPLRFDWFCRLGIILLFLLLMAVSAQ